MSCEPEHLTIKRWAPKVRVVYDYYPFGLSWENPKLPNDPEGVHDHAYQDKEFQFAEFSTGHGLALYDFHARMYDPATGRWLVPDPAEQFANPYLAMGNNPAMYVDPDGQIAFMAVVGIFAAVQLGADMIRNDFEMNIGEIGMSLGLGAVQGVLAASGAGGLVAYAGKNAGLLTLGSAISGQINVPIVETDNFSLSLSPSLATGANGVRLGANAFAKVSIGGASLSFGYSIGRNFTSADLSGSMSEAKWSSIASGSFGWSGNGWGASYGLTHYGGNYSSTIGRLGFSAGRFSFSHENDFLAPGNEDMYRTGRLNASWQVNDDITLNAGLEVFTGRPNGAQVPNSKARSGYSYGEDVALRNGIASFGVQHRGNDYRVGWNSEGIRNVQNGWHDFMGSWAGRNIFRFSGPSNHFSIMSYQGTAYTYFGNTNPFTGYGF